LFSSGETIYLETSLTESPLAGTTTLKAGTIIVGLYCFGIIK
jgi:hypothetical protein